MKEEKKEKKRLRVYWEKRGEWIKLKIGISLSVELTEFGGKKKMVPMR